MEKIIVYGIPNCDSMKKTFNWLTENKIPYTFHNYKTEGISLKKLEQWSKKVPWESFFNKKSSTWRSIEADYTADMLTKSGTFTLMVQNNSIIKRPVIEAGKKLIIGFNGKILTDELNK